DAAGREVATRTFVTSPDGSWYRYLGYQVTAGGVYYLGVSSDTNVSYDPVHGTPGVAAEIDGFYALTLTAVPSRDDDNTLATATPITLNDQGGAGVNGHINDENDFDLFRLTLQAGQRLVAQVQTSEWFPQFELRLFDAAGHELRHVESSYSWTHQL